MKLLEAYSSPSLSLPNLGTLMINKGFERETANQVLLDDIADLVERFSLDASLSPNDRRTHDTTRAKGFTDYPTYQHSV